MGAESFSASSLSPGRDGMGIQDGIAPLDAAWTGFHKDRVLRFVDRIWHVRGSVDLAPGQSADDAFNKLDPLFRETGTSRERTGDTLIFRKEDPAAQDKMSVFDSGVLHVENRAAGSVLRYHLISRTLLLCFLAPLLFLAFAGATIGLGKLHKPETKAEAAAAKAKADKKQAAPQLNPIDKFLGAPAPEKKGKKKKGDEPEGRNKKPTPTPAYVFAAIFATLYAVGRMLEDRLVRSLFKKTLLGR